MYFMFFQMVFQTNLVVQEVKNIIQNISNYFSYLFRNYQWKNNVNSLKKNFLIGKVT